ncbi:hypothetical protein [Goodfellowiella coeruleoviolacea]|uniref:Integral membrane protein n=1 Tax=Goodfellowiella coeruleoviolacea TaxID=334858 RepID=A0AAE3KH67_9PSEU|nr:hypothetical protein [Goodfellowiella coeruleoviolacea]MCP2167991.1 hypothetical protein [Goodfellowiella coeruleoviolacea]
MPSKNPTPEPPAEAGSDAGQRGSGGPSQLRVAGALVGVQGLAGLGFAIALAVSAVRVGNQPGLNIFGELGYFAVLSAGVLAAAVGLLLGRRWARTPAIVVQLLLLGVAWYLREADRLVIAVGVGLFCLSVIALLLSNPVRAWAAHRLDTAGHDAT